MQATFSPNRDCSSTRFGNSRTQGSHQVDQTSSTTTLPLNCSRRFCVSSQLRISTLGAGAAFCAGAVSFFGDAAGADAEPRCSIVADEPQPQQQRANPAAQIQVVFRVVCR